MSGVLTSKLFLKNREGRGEKKEKRTNRRKKGETETQTLGDDGYVYCLDCGHSNTGMYICPSSPNCIH